METSSWKPPDGALSWRGEAPLPRVGTATESMRSSARTNRCTRSCSSARIKHHRCLPRTRRAHARAHTHRGTHTHTHTHTHTPARTHTQTHTVALAWMLMPTRHCMPLCNNERERTHTAQPGHARTRTHARTHTWVHHGCMRTHAARREHRCRARLTASAPASGRLLAPLAITCVLVSARKFRAEVS